MLFIVFFQWQLSRIDNVIKQAELAFQYRDTYASHPLMILCHFYYCLARIKKSSESSLNSLYDHFSLMEDMAISNPSNYKAMYLMLSAEKSRVSGVGDPSNLYEEALVWAGQNNLPMQKALACELAGDFWRERSRSIISTGYSQISASVYESLGYYYRASSLSMKASISEKAENFAALFTSKIGQNGSARFQLTDLISQSQNIIEIKALSTTLLRIAETLISQIGADFAVLVQKGIRGFEARKAIKKGLNWNLESITTDSLLNYFITAEVLRQDWISGKERMVEFEKDQFSVDGVGIRSLLFIPLTYLGRNQASVYLMSTRSLKSLEDSELAVLKLYAAQGAVSIQNHLVLADRDEGIIREAENKSAKVLLSDLSTEIESSGNYDVARFYRSAPKIGGDWYGHYFDPVANIAFLFVGEVTGQGLPSAIITGIAAGAVSGAVHGLLTSSRAGNAYDAGKELSRIMSSANFALAKGSAQEKKVMTMLGLAFAVNEEKLFVANAAHNFPYLVSEKGVRKITTRGELFGLTEQANYEVIELPFSSGDSIVAYTDGIIENQGENGENFSLQKLKRILKSHSRSSASQQLDAIVQQGEGIWGDTPEDDTTLLVLQNIDKVA